MYIVYCILYDQRVGQGEHKLNLSFVMMLMVLILMMVMMMFMMMIKVIEGCIMFAGCNRRGSFPRLSSSDGKQGSISCLVFFTITSIDNAIQVNLTIRQNPSQRSTKNLCPSTSKRPSLSLTM